MSQPTAPKQTPLNQGYITKAMRDKTPEEQRASIRRMIEKREKAGLKPDSTVIKKATKELPHQKIKEFFKKGSELDVVQRSSKYKK